MICITDTVTRSGYQNLSISVYKKGSGKILRITWVPNLGLVLLICSLESLGILMQNKSLKILMFVYLSIVSLLILMTPMFGISLMYIDNSRIL